MLFFFQGNLIISILSTIMLVIMAITSGWIFNLCWRLLFIENQQLIFWNFIIMGIFTIYILFLFYLNWIIKWTNFNTVNWIIQISEFSCFFYDGNKFMLVISFETTKQINLYRFEIHIFYRKLALDMNSAQIYYFS